MNSTGWFKFHRSIMDHPRSDDPDWLLVWVYLLKHAAYAPFKTRFQGEIIELQPGQLVTGRKAIAAKTRVSESKIQRVLALMESEHQIEQQTESKCRLISIKNWEKYQGCDSGEQQNEHQLNNNWTATEQQLNTLKRREEEKKEEQEAAPKPAPTRKPRGRVPFEPTPDSLTVFKVWKLQFPMDDAPRSQTCKNIQTRLATLPLQALLFSVLAYRAKVREEAARRPEGVMTYKGSNFFGEKAYFEAYLPKPGQLENPRVQERIEAVLAAVTEPLAQITETSA
jgi:hypothetical protein